MIYSDHFKNTEIQGFYKLYYPEQFLEDEKYHSSNTLESEIFDILNQKEISFEYLISQYKKQEDLKNEINKLKYFSHYCIITNKGSIVIGINVTNVCCNQPGISPLKWDIETNPIIQEVVLNERKSESNIDSLNTDAEISFTIKTSNGNKIELKVFNKNNNDGYYNNEIVYTSILGDKTYLSYEEL